MQNEMHSENAERRDVGTWLEDTTSQDPVLGRLFPQLRRLAASEAPLLLLGEPGSGRELAARAIHNLSERAAHPLVVIDCGDFSDALIEAELLGINGNAAAAPATSSSAAAAICRTARVTSPPRPRPCCEATAGPRTCASCARSWRTRLSGRAASGSASRTWRSGSAASSAVDPCRPSEKSR